MNKFLRMDLELYTASLQRILAVLGTEMDSRKATRFAAILAVLVTASFSKAGRSRVHRFKERPRRCRLCSKSCLGDSGTLYSAPEERLFLNSLEREYSLT